MSARRAAGTGTDGGSRLRVRDTGPGQGAGSEADPQGAPILNARIAIVATIVIGQLWALTVALNIWFSGEGVTVLVAFQAISFALALVVWSSSRSHR